jgi:hypothetical protein
VLEILGVERLADEVGRSALRLEAHQIEGDPLHAASDPSSGEDDGEIWTQAHAGTMVERK